MNPGDFRKRITLLCPKSKTRDEMGGWTKPEYEEVCTIWAMQKDKTSSFKQVIGDYVTVNTCYFVTRPLPDKYSFGTDWRIISEGDHYVINSVVRLKDMPPYYIEIEATRIGGMG